MSRGRPSENVEIRTKYVQTVKQVPSKPELGWVSTWHYDLNKFANGPFKVEHTPPKGERSPKPKLDQRPYGGQPVVMVFKTSNRSNAKTKIKIFNKNIDYIISAESLPGVPKKAVILDLGVGKSMIEAYSKKYNLN